MKKSVTKKKITIDDLAEITARQFNRVDEKLETSFEQLDNKIDTEIGALRSEMKIGFSNAHRELELKTTELDQKITKIDEKLDIVIEKMDSFIVFVAKNHEPRIKKLETQALELQSA